VDAIIGEIQYRVHKRSKARIFMSFQHSRTVVYATLGFILLVLSVCKVDLCWIVLSIKIAIFHGRLPFANHFKTLEKERKLMEHPEYEM
jgi:hypothetical protein